MGVAVHEDAELELPSFFPPYPCDKLVDVIVYSERIIVRYPVVDEPHRVLYYTGVHLRTYLPNSFILQVPPYLYELPCGVYEYGKGDHECP